MEGDNFEDFVKLIDVNYDDGRLWLELRVNKFV